MAFLENFDTICEMASEAAQAAAKKTKKLAEIAKANVSIYSEEDKIKKAQLELGKLYYRDYVIGEELDDAEYLPWCRRIDEAKQTIADLRDYIEELKAEQVAMDNEQAKSTSVSVPAAEVAPVAEDSDFVDAQIASSNDGEGENDDDDDDIEVEIVVVDNPKAEASTPSDPE